ncbi:hypothetical protein N8Z47_02485 [Salibacteraceae bacterium]|nr:hypothetical protein [Salibacteraceae bacterium]
MRGLLYIMIVSFSFCGCSQSSQEPETTSINTVSMQREVAGQVSDSVRVISLPAPMQIPAVLRTTNANYNKDVLFPSDLADKSFFRSTILFGIYMVDLAYVGAFNDQQAARVYFNNCKRIGDDLGLGYELDSKFTQQFEKNLSQPDSLGHLIMKMYGIGHEYFRQNEKEGIGLLMITGCFFEGMHLGFEEAKDNDMVLFLHIMNQHQVYAENLLLALDNFEIPSEIQSEYEILVETRTLLQKLNAPSANEIRMGQSSFTQVDISAINELKELTNEFGHSMEI